MATTIIQSYCSVKNCVTFYIPNFKFPDGILIFGQLEKPLNKYSTNKFESRSICSGSMLFINKLYDEKYSFWIGFLVINLDFWAEKSNEFHLNKEYIC